ncbi:MAG: OsmC family protein [Gemmatimonadota bacterium]
MQRTDQGKADAAEDVKWVAARVDGGYRTAITAGPHAVVVDEPVELGGTDDGMTPYQLLLASVASCMALTMRMYADRKAWPLDGASVHVRTAPALAPDREVLAAGAGRVTRLERRIELHGALTEEQRVRLLEIADRCPVKRNLEAGLQVVGAA